MIKNYKLPIYFTWLPLGFIAIGIVFNTIMGLILLKNKEAKKVNCFLYLAVIALFDTLSLFTWNLDEFLRPNYNFEIENLNIHTCRIFLYIQFVSLQVGSVLRSLLCIERYYFVMKIVNSPHWLTKKLFGIRKSVKNWIKYVLLVICALNFHLLFKQKDLKLNKSHANETNFNCYDTKSTWNLMNMLITCVLPSVIMPIFDILLFYKSYISKKRMASAIAKVQLRASTSFTFSLLYISIIYIVLHTPFNVYSSFFTSNEQTKASVILSFIFIEMLFSQHALLFFELYFTNRKFRSILNKYLKREVSKIKKTKPLLEMPSKGGTTFY